MTDTTTTRGLLALLLDRVERGALLPNEAPLLRPLVAAEQAAAAPKRRYCRGSDGDDIGTAYMDAQTALARVRERCQQVRDREGPGGMINASQILRLLSRTWPDGNYAVLDGPSPTPADTPTLAACSVCGSRNVCGDCFLCRCGQVPCVRTGVNDPTVSAAAGAGPSVGTEAPA